MQALKVLEKGFKVWYGHFVGMQLALMGGERSGINFSEFWDEVLESKFAGVVIDIEPP